MRKNKSILNLSLTKRTIILLIFAVVVSVILSFSFSQSDMSFTQLLILIMLPTGSLVLIAYWWQVTVDKQLILAKEILVNIHKKKDLTPKELEINDGISGQLLEVVFDIQDDFRELLQNIIQDCDYLGFASEEMATVVQRSKDIIAKQQVETEMVATAISEMAATVNEVAENAQRASHASHTAKEEAVEGKSVVYQTMQSINSLTKEMEKTAGVIQELEGNSESIGTVLDVIKSIAEQTNLLALNAAIEAARAGEQGRGFAVVADEVRNLAQRTQHSTQEIEEIIVSLQEGSKNAVKVIAESRSSIEDSSELANRATNTLDSIGSAVTLIDQMNSEIASASEAQKRVAEDSSKNIFNISDMAEQSTKSAVDINGALDIFSEQVSHIKGLSDKYRLQ
ncbi:methyl-accepting chemotaxis protein [Aliikangiella maris]|uniref:Methyl-accepting chemotaxis protein n=2 Tax=Aliikangiella maris TaxID=3162458 RepID=A0ABV2BT39_9GAMM